MHSKLLCLSLLAMACGSPPTPDAGATDAGLESDAGAPDAGLPDAGLDAGVLDSGTRDAGQPDAGPRGDAGTVLVRIVAANLSSGNLQSYDAGHGARILQGVRPDVVLLQEFNVGANALADLRGFIDTTFGPEFQYAREPMGRIPNGVISRWPIAESGSWDDPLTTDRDLAWARIDVPGPKDLWVVSVHLLTSNPTDRSTQADGLVALLQANIAAGELIVIGGDFNTNNRNEACFTAFSAVVSTAAPYPADQAGNTNTNTTRNRPYDQLLVSPELRALQVPTRIGTNRFDAGLVVDTRVYSPIEDLAPALATDSAAAGMQHMAVVKDFALPQ